jgi:hypothetical protein
MPIGDAAISHLALRNQLVRTPNDFCLSCPFSCHAAIVVLTCYGQGVCGDLRAIRPDSLCQQVVNARHGHQITELRNTPGSSTSKSPSISVARGWILTLIHRQYVAGLGCLLKMQFDTADIELMQDQLDALFDGRMVGAIAGDEFLDNVPQCRGRQLQMGIAHSVNVQPTVKSIAVSPLLQPTKLACVSSNTQQARQFAQRERRR